MRVKILFICALCISCSLAFADDYLGSLGTNRYDRNSINNPDQRGQLRLSPV